MTPSSHEEFEIRDLDREALERKTGKSISELIDDGIEISETLLKEDEIDRQMERGFNKNVSSGSPSLTHITDEQDRQVYDNDGYEVEYDD